MVNFPKKKLEIKKFTNVFVYIISPFKTPAGKFIDVPTAVAKVGKQSSQHNLIKLAFCFGKYCCFLQLFKGGCAKMANAKLGEGRK